jgi:uncharacterized alkaline shock family protein YloU
VNDKPGLANVRQTPSGRIDVASRAIATTVAEAVMRCYGVVGMSPRNLRDSAANVLRPEDQHKGIDVQIAGDQITIDLYVVIEYGTRIATVARNIMDNVHYAVERLLGESPTTVNVHVQGLRLEQPEGGESLGDRLRRIGTKGGVRGQRDE